MIINNISTHKSFHVSANTGDTVAELKDIITDVIGVPSRFQQVSFKGTTLQNESKLVDCGVDPTKAEVDLTLTLHGAACRNCGCNCGGGCKCIIS